MEACLFWTPPLQKVCLVQHVNKGFPFYLFIEDKREQALYSISFQIDEQNKKKHLFLTELIINT